MALPTQPGSPALIVLAAGSAQRFGSPKQLAAVGPKGEAILDYTVRDARAAGFGEIVLVVRADLEATLAGHVAAYWPSDIAADVHYTAQDREDWSRKAAQAGRAKPLGTAHAVVTGASDGRIERPFAVVNGDDLYGAEAFTLLHAGLATGRNTLVAYEVANTLLGPRPVKRALCDVDEHGRLQNLREGAVEAAADGLVWTSEAGDDRRPLSGRELVSMNCWAFTSDIIDGLREAIDEFVRDPVKLAGTAELLLPDVVAHLHAVEGLAFDVQPATGRCLGLTHAADLDLLRAVLTEPAW